MSKDDDPISEIRRIRHSISEEFGHDPKRYIAYLEKAGSDYPDQTRVPNILHRRSSCPSPRRMPVSR